MKLLFCLKNTSISKDIVNALYKDNYAITIVKDCLVEDIEKYGAIILDDEENFQIIKDIYPNDIILINIKDTNAYHLENNFTYDQLAKILKDINKKTIQNKTISFGNTTINEDLKINTTNGYDYLTPQEHAILYILFQNPNCIHTSNELFCEVWGYYSNCDITIIYVYFNYIRKKLEKIGSNVIIKAKRNKGYHLEIK